MDYKEKNIVASALELFKQYGIRSVSLDDICVRAALSKKTLYRFFSNKAELIEKVIQYKMEQAVVNLQKRKSINWNALDELLEHSKYVHQHINQVNPAFLYDLNKYYPEIYRQFIQKKREKVLIDVKENLRQGIKEGFYRNDLKIELVALLYVQKLEDMHNPEFISSGNFSFERIFEVMFENHIRGIANKAGIDYYEQQKPKLNFKITDQ